MSSSRCMARTLFDETVITETNTPEYATYQFSIGNCACYYSTKLMKSGGGIVVLVKNKWLPRKVTLSFSYSYYLALNISDSDYPDFLWCRFAIYTHPTPIGASMN